LRAADAELVARRSEDLTFDKTDVKDAVLITRLTAQLRCHGPEPIDETWGRLRHLGVLAAVDAHRSAVLHCTSEAAELTHRPVALVFW
jgi:hypothetical protein